MATKFEMITTLTLTNDPLVRERLRAKLAQYEQRLAGLTPDKDPDSAYKLHLLKELLEKGTVDVLRFLPELQKRFGWHIERYFTNAVFVISGYNGNDVTGLTGGRGF